MKHSRVIDDLRPVEAHYLLNYAGKESVKLKGTGWSWNIKKMNPNIYQYILCICVYLANEGYIKPAKSTFFHPQFIPLALTEKGKSLLSHPDLRSRLYENIDYWEDRSLKVNSLLRPYEIKSLKAIDEDESRDLMDIISHEVRWVGFGRYMTKRGFLRTEQRKKGWLIFKWNVTHYRPNDQFNKAIEELDELKDQISSAVSQGNQDKYLMNMSFAFPSSGLSTAFLKYASKEIADVVDAADKIKLPSGPGQGCPT